MGIHFPAARLAAAVSGALALSMLVPLGGGTPAAAAAASSLQAAFDNVGISTPATASAGNFDGIGDSFAAAGLASDALVPGQSLPHDGLRIGWPDVPPGHPDNVLADGQQIAISGTGSVLGVVGASGYGSTTGTFTIGYADGSTSTATVTFADWVDTSAASGTDLLATTAGWNPGGTTPVSLFYAAIPLTAGARVTSVTLPTIGAGVARNVPSMHVFTLNIGSPGQDAAGGPGRVLLRRGPQGLRGLAADSASKVWYTVAGGTLSDTYAPTIDNTDVKSLDPIVTGPGFTALQPRDMTYTVSLARWQRDGLRGHRDGRGTPLPVGQRLHHRPGRRGGGHPGQPGAAARRPVRAERVPALQPAAERARWRRLSQLRRRVGHGRAHRPRAGSAVLLDQLVHRGGEPQLRLAGLCRAGRQHPVRARCRPGSPGRPATG